MAWQVLADEFSWQAWTREGASRVLPPSGIRRAWAWRSLLRRPPEVDFLLIESAWENFRRREDRYQVPIELATAYRKAGIPVVFWNKEDPMHFEKFLPLALASDVVLTTDSDSVRCYRDAGCKGAVDVMTFAAQPELHRQYLKKDAKKDLFFAGTLRPHHEDRMTGFGNVLIPAVEFGLEIYSRKGAWPDECKHCVVGSFSYLDLLRRYSAYQVGINISSITNSPTMFPRRVVEMPLANIFVVSDQCRALTNLFPEIPQSDSPAKTRDLLSHFLSADNERADVLSKLKRRILQQHTYAHRVDQMRALVS